MKRALILGTVVALAALGLVACGGDDDDDETTAAATTATTETAPAGGAASTVSLSSPADGSLAFDKTSATAKAGSVTIDYDNPASLSHDVVVEDEAGNELGKTDLISNSTTSATVDLAPGTYTFYCDVPGHREGGMEGTLTVK
jgi:plastocyanin